MKQVWMTLFMHREWAGLGMNPRFHACRVGKGALEAAPRFGATARRTKPRPSGLAFLKVDR